MNNTSGLQILEDIAIKWQTAKGVGSVYLSKKSLSLIKADVSF